MKSVVLKRETEDGFEICEDEDVMVFPDPDEEYAWIDTAAVFDIFVNAMEAENTEPKDEEIWAKCLLS